MFKKVFSAIGNWAKSLFKKHEEQLSQMVKALGPVVAQTALRSDLSGSEKKKLIIDRVKQEAEKTGKEIALSVVNEAIEVATNKYKLEVGTLGAEQLDNTLKAVLNSVLNETK